MRARTRGAPATIPRSGAVFVAIVVGAAAIGALVGASVGGEWLIGAGSAAGLAALIGAWLATMPGGSPEANGGGYYGYSDDGGYRGDGRDGGGGGADRGGGGGDGGCL
jgi:hypothetical protein